MTNETSFESFYNSPFRICEINCKFSKNFFCKFHCKNVWIKNVQKMIKYACFEKFLTMPFQICQKRRVVFRRVVFKQFGKVLYRTCATRFLMSWSFQKLNIIKIWQLKKGHNKDLVCYRKNKPLRQCAWGLRQLV